MVQLAGVIGRRIRSYRMQMGFSQEQLAERSNLHATYIGQLEREEKNATLESIEKVAAALDVSLSELFENTEAYRKNKVQDEMRIFELIHGVPAVQQKKILRILEILVDYEK